MRVFQGMGAKHRDIILETHELVRHFTSAKGLFRTPTVVRAVDGVNLSVRRGETLAIVGESGCGKSTLARLLLRLITPSAGYVSYNGRNLETLTAVELRALRADMQFIFQDPFSSLNPRMTVGELVGEPLLIHAKLPKAQRRERVSELLEKVGLRAEHQDRYPHEFSGGQRQRIGISRALASSPTLLIGDEPVSALDVSVQAQIVNLLEKLKEDLGLTLIVIAHDLAVIRHMSDRIAVMYLGEVVEQGETETVFQQPLHPYTRALIDAIPVPIPGAVKHQTALGGDIPSPVAPPGGCRFHTRCAHATGLCSSTQPTLSTAHDTHSVACHHWSAIQAAMPNNTATLGNMSVRSREAQQRFSLYRDYSKHRDTEAMRAADRTTPASFTSR